MKSKILLIASLSFLLPFIAAAADPVATVVNPETQNEATTSIETPKDAKKEELKKQLADTINIYSAIVNSLQRLSSRVADREDILVTQGGISKIAKDAIDSKRNSIDDKLTNLNDRINNDLTKAAMALVNATKPSKPLKDFKKEANKIKAEIISTHKSILDLIEMVKKDSLSADGKGSDNNASSTDNSTDQNN